MRFNMEELNAQPQAQEAAQAESAEVKETPSDAEVKTIKVKYNHEEMELPIDEAVKHIQKGMNYDKVFDQLEQLKGDKALKFLDEQSKKLGKSREQLVDLWESELRQREVDQYAEANGYPPEIAQKLLEAEQIKQREVEKERIANEKAIQEAEKTERNKKQLADFVEKNPSVKVEELPKEVLDDWLEQGIPLLKAYKAYQAEQIPSIQERLKAMEEKLNADETNKSNAETSMGSTETKGNTTIKEINQETIGKMSQSQIKQNWNVIQKLIEEGKLM